MTVTDVKKIKADAAAGLKRSAKLVGDLARLRTLPMCSPSPSPSPAVPTLPVQSESEELDQKTIHSARLSSSLAATLAVMNLTNPDQELTIVETALYLKEQGAKAARGDLSKLQEMLAIQSRTLDLVFNDFLIKASSQSNFDIKEKYCRLAFKAQSQCRATVESLAVIQQGPAIFARQANITNGPQQVNNAISHDVSTSLKPAPVLAEREIQAAKLLDSVPANIEPLEVSRMGNKE